LLHCSVILGRPSCPNAFPFEEEVSSEKNPVRTDGVGAPSSPGSSGSPQEIMVMSTATLTEASRKGQRMLRMVKPPVQFGYLGIL